MYEWGVSVGLSHTVPEKSTLTFDFAANGDALFCPLFTPPNCSLHQAGAEGQQLEARGGGGNREIRNPAKGSAKLCQHPPALFPPPPPKTSAGAAPELLGAHGEHGLPYRCLHHSFLFPFLSHNWKCQAVNTPHSAASRNPLYGHGVELLF